MSKHLSTEQKQQLESALLASRAALDHQRSDHLEGHTRTEHAREILLQDADDATQHGVDREVDFARTDREAVALTEIEQALQRLRAGQYGLCIECGADIPVARLQLAPQAARCVACASQHERGQQRPTAL